MFRKPRLRTRIAIGLVGFSLSTSLAFGVLTYWAADVMEILVLEQNIGERARRAASVLRSGQTPQLPAEDWYYGRLQSDGNVAPEIAQLPSGSHHDVLIDGREFHVWIEPVQDDRLFLFYDLSMIEAYEGQLVVFLISIGAVLGVFAFALGLWLTPWVAQPVSALAARVSRLSQNAGGFDTTHDDDADLAVLARAIDLFLRRNHDLVSRERAFTGMASHELRNPVASIGAALDVIALKPAASEIAQPLNRIRRNTDRMSSLIDVLLDLARDQNLDRREDDVCRPADLVREIVGEHESSSGAQAFKFDLDLNDACLLSVRPAVFSVIANNLISNAVAHSTGQTINVRLDGKSFTVESEGEAGPAADKRRLGLTIVDAICARFGWTFHLATDRRTTAATVLLGGTALP